MTNYFKNLVHLKTVYNEFEEMRKRDYEKEKKTQSKRHLVVVHFYYT